MTQLSETEILEGNKLIADFMEIRRLGFEMFSWRPGCQEPLQEKHLNYHASWGWLMPVVEKINTVTVPEDSRGSDVTYVVTIEPGYCVISAGGEGIVSEQQAFDSGEPLIDTVYRAVVEFIKWHKSLPLQ